MAFWAVIAMATGTWWTFATVWRLLRPAPSHPLWSLVLRDIVAAPLVGLLAARLLGSA
ncbi:MAG: hypothetical protein RMK01_05665 [Thermomicrobium sp.]|nr:hypothetical protein [Thermomicrobium sp.]MDW8059543.1 hypothetical protein [Thermomicrobium sp.]